MIILITGGKGQVGKEITELLQPFYKVFSFSSQDLNVTDTDQVNRIVAAINPDVIIYCAAYTAVDLAEQEPEKAYAINASGTKNIAIAAQKCGAKLVYISTDYVFDGSKGLPYTENDKTCPQSVYGKSKLAGEIYASNLCDKYFVVRTSWVYGRYGVNFVKTLLQRSHQQTVFHIVDDQRGSPTSSLDLCQFLIKLIATEEYGYYHVTNQGCCTWYEFSNAIVKYRKLNHVTVIPCTTDMFKGAAPRPRYSVLDGYKASLFGWNVMGKWEDALAYFLMHVEDGRMAIIHAK